MTKRHGKFFLATAAVGAGLGAYAAYEPYRFRLRTTLVPCRPGTPSLDVLHVSDTHMTARSGRLVRWLEELPDHVERQPDIVVATGDLIDNNEGIEGAVRALSRLEGRLGSYYVLGSHDYFQTHWRPGAYLKYFSRGRGGVHAKYAQTQALEAGLREKGWTPLTNVTEIVQDGDVRIRLAGVDDPYIRRHRTGHIHRAGRDDFALGLVHAPDVVSDWILAGFDLVVAGHTHGGQVRLPLLGAVVTNCSLPAALAGGLHAVGNGWLHVSPGLGNGRFAPIRFNERPEATLLQVRAQRS
jgi:uncharacterized protein